MSGLPGSTGYGFPSCVARGDLDGDGLQDVVVAVSSGPIVTLMSRDDGNFTGRLATDFDAGAQACALGDFDGDGKLDLVVDYFRGNGITFALLKGDGEGGFGPASYFGTNGYAGRLLVGDLNEDGKADLVIGVGPALLPFLGNGFAGFLPQPAIVGLAADQSNDVVLADLDGDGHLDFAGLSTDGTSGLAALLGRGDGTFGAAIVSRLDFDARHLLAADVNRDGKVDLVAGPSTDGIVKTLLGDGHGAFTFGASSLVARDFGSPAIEDLDGDGTPDLVSGDLDGGSMGQGSVR